MLQTFYIINYALSQFVCFFHRLTFGVYSYNRFGIRFTQMNPFVSKFNLHSTNGVYRLIFILFSHCFQNIIHINIRSQFYLIL